MKALAFCGKRLAVPLLIALTASEALADEVCGDHGQLNSTSGGCSCYNTMPAPGQYGWAGRNCSMKVFGAQLDASDVTQGCQSTNCSSLAPNEWMCFAFALPWKSSSQPWNYLTVELNRTNNDSRADPDLYGMFYGGSSQRDDALETSTYLYDFRETSSSSHARVVKTVEKSSFSNKDYTGVWLCVKAYGDTFNKGPTFSLKANATLCPSGFDGQGRLTECSTRVDAPDSEKHHTGCNADGTCVCKAPYRRPVPSVYPELGFEDCSAELRSIPDHPASVDTFFLGQHEQVGPKQWQFYAFNVTQEDYQVVVNMAGEVTAECDRFGYMGLYTKFGQPPGSRFNQYDYRPAWDYFREDDSDMEVKFDASLEGFQTGTWYVGVAGDDFLTCNYTLTIDKFACPMNCNGHGSCSIQGPNRTCDCNEGYFGSDCSMESRTLRYGELVSKTNQSFEYDYFDLPAITASMLTRSIEIRLSASYSSPTYSFYSAAKPELLLVRGDYTSYPTAGNYTFREVLAEANKKFDITLCPSQLQQGTWRAAVYNPMHVYKLDFNLTATKQVNCLNDCSGHGTCSEEGLCICSGNWAGGDCSVSPTASCQPGTRTPARMEAAHGTCWRECVCDAGAGAQCHYATGGCSEFTCDSSLYRRKGSAFECVQDACTRDVWREELGHACLHKCTCPQDGGPCTVPGSCDASSFVCQAGYRRFSTGEARCYPEGCSEGTLQKTEELDVENGVGLAVCTCGTIESEQTAKCSFASSSPDSLAVTCAPGYTLVGATKRGVSGLMIGGRCELHGKAGTPWWGVFLWVFFALLAGSGCGAAAWWYYKEYWGPGRGLNQALYSELSTGNDF